MADEEWPICWCQLCFLLRFSLKFFVENPKIRGKIPMKSLNNNNKSIWMVYFVKSMKFSLKIHPDKPSSSWGYPHGIFPEVQVLEPCRIMASKGNSALESSAVPERIGRDGRGTFRRADFSHLCRKGGFHKWRIPIIPTSWMLYFMENPIISY